MMLCLVVGKFEFDKMFEECDFINYNIVLVFD